MFKYTIALSDCKHVIEEILKKKMEEHGDQPWYVAGFNAALAVLKPELRSRDNKLTEVTSKYHALETPLRICQWIEDYEKRYGTWVDLDPQERADALSTGLDLRIAVRMKKWRRMLASVNRGDIRVLKTRLPPLIKLSQAEFAEAIGYAHHYISEYIIHAIGRIA